MSNEGQRASPVTARGPRRYLFAVVLMAIVIAVVLLMITRSDGSGNASSPSLSRLETTIAPTTRAPNSESDVVTRLREILEVREEAFRERDASLFEDVYTSDCACLRAGRDAIAALKKEKVQWRNRSISLEIESARSMNSRLWEVVALFISNSFRIETEEGMLVREVPAERLRYRFLLVRTSEADPWRLGSASPVEG
jgi:hypothetical protein